MSQLAAYMERVHAHLPKTTWEQVTTEDLRATIVNYPDSEEATLAQAEWKRRMGKEFLEEYPFYSYLFKK